MDHDDCFQLWQCTPILPRWAGACLGKDSIGWHYASQHRLQAGQENGCQTLHARVHIFHKEDNQCWSPRAHP